MKKFLKSNLFYGLTSVILAIFLMFYVDSLENPISEKNFVVSLSYKNLAEGLILDTEPKPVEIRVRGDRSLVYSTGADSIKAWLDFSQAKAGAGTYKVQIQLPNGLQMAWVHPTEREVYLDQEGSKVIPLKFKTLNEVASGYGNFEPVISPTEIRIRGPLLILEGIDHGQVNVDLSGLKADYRGQHSVVLVGENGVQIQDGRIVLSQKKVQVFVPVTENMSSKSVAVRPALSGEIQENWVVNSVEVKPTSVRITGAFDLIKSLEYLTTEPIDLTQITQDFKGKVNLSIPEGVGVLDGVQVDLEINVEENLIKRLIPAVPLEVRNAPEGKSYGTLPIQVDVELLAYPWIFANDSKEAGYKTGVKAYVDLKGQPADNQDYEIKIECPTDFRVGTVIPATARLHQ